MISPASVKVGSEPPIDLLQHVAIRAARSLAGIGPLLPFTYQLGFCECSPLSGHSLR